MNIKIMILVAIIRSLLHTDGVRAYLRHLFIYSAYCLSDLQFSEIPTPHIQSFRSGLVLFL